jgi:hypothetical protein
MLYKSKNSRAAIPGYTLIPKGDHYQVKKITLTANRVKKDPAFQRTRTYAGEVAKASRLGKHIRRALLQHLNIKPYIAQLVSELMTSLRCDPSPGRDWTTACFDNLIGFNLNTRADWQQAAAIHPEVVANTNKNWVTTRLPAFVPVQTLIPPEGITHCRIFATTAAINCREDEEAESITKTTTLIPLKQIQIKACHLTAELTNMKDRLIIVAVGIHWYGPVGCKGPLVRKPPGPLQIIYSRLQ